MKQVSNNSILYNIDTIADNQNTIGYRYDGMPEEDKLMIQILEKHYDKVYQENIKHANPKKYIEDKYYNQDSPYYCWHMTADQRRIAYLNEKRMLETGGKYRYGLVPYDYALRNNPDLYIGGKKDHILLTGIKGNIRHDVLLMSR